MKGINVVTLEQIHKAIHDYKVAYPFVSNKRMAEACGANYFAFLQFRKNVDYKITYPVYVAIAKFFVPDEEVMPYVDYRKITGTTLGRPPLPYPWLVHPENNKFVWNPETREVITKQELWLRILPRPQPITPNEQPEQQAPALESTATAA